MKLEEQASRIREFYEEYLEYLEDYLKGDESIYAVERLCELLIQSIIDFAAIALARKGKSRYSTYRELLSWLSQELGLDEELGDFMKRLAGFRDVLVHGYADIDRGFEQESFIEIRDKLDKVIVLIERYAEGDPCIDFVKERLSKMFAEKYGDEIKYAVVFGSVAREGCGRDVDIAVKFKTRPRSALDLGMLIVDIAEALGLHEDLVDLVDIDNAPLGLLKSIIEDAVPIYGDLEEIRDDLTRKYILMLDYWETKKYIKKKLASDTRRRLQLASTHSDT